MPHPANEEVSVPQVCQRLKTGITQEVGGLGQASMNPLSPKAVDIGVSGVPGDDARYFVGGFFGYRSENCSLSCQVGEGTVSGRLAL
jgi:hypothetical protein